LKNKYQNIMFSSFKIQNLKFKIPIFSYFQYPFFERII
jgi:hypothetical protein